jgi:sugar phosphate isomerase/epimerase
MQFDSGAIAQNGEDPATVLQNSAALIGHVHASEPQLLPLGDGGTDHGAMHRALMTHLPDHIVTIEMVATAQEPHLVAIERALQVATMSYRPDSALRPPVL